MKKEKRGEKRRIESDITNLRMYINRKMERRGETGGKRKIKIKELNAKYRLKKKGINLVIEELKQRFIVKKTKVKTYEQRISQFEQNQLFHFKQKQIYKEMNGEKLGDRIIPNYEDRIKFWSDIWSIRQEYHR